MNKTELIKDSVILSNIIQVMRLATNKVVARTNDLIPESNEELGDVGSTFHAATLAARLSLSESEPEPEQEPVTEEPVKEEPPKEEPKAEEPGEEPETSDEPESDDEEGSVDDGDNWD